jgi:hypothetical protein
MLGRIVLRMRSVADVERKERKSKWRRERGVSA